MRHRRIDDDAVVVGIHAEGHAVETVKRPSLKGKLAKDVEDLKEVNGNGAKTRRDEKSEKARSRKPEEVIPLDENDFKDF